MICRSTSLTAKVDNLHLPPTVCFTCMVPWLEVFWRVGVLKAKSLNQMGCWQVLGGLDRCSLLISSKSLLPPIHIQKILPWFLKSLLISINSSCSPLKFQCIRIARLSQLFHCPVLKMSLLYPNINNMTLLFKTSRLMHMCCLPQCLQSNWIKLINLMFLC